MDMDFQKQRTTEHIHIFFDLEFGIRNLIVVRLQFSAVRSNAILGKKSCYCGIYIVEVTGNGDSYSSGPEGKLHDWWQCSQQA